MARLEGKISLAYEDTSLSAIMMAMRRTTIQAEPELLERARIAAAKEGVSMSELVREGLEMRLSRSRTKPRVGAIADSGHSDTGREASRGRVPPC